MSSNHSRRGPPQSSAEKEKVTLAFLYYLLPVTFAHLPIISYTFILSTPTVFSHSNPPKFYVHLKKIIPSLSVGSNKYPQYENRNQGPKMNHLDISLYSKGLLCLFQSSKSLSPSFCISVLGKLQQAIWLVNTTLLS